jgi:hypothetical protein
MPTSCRRCCSPAPTPMAQQCRYGGCKQLPSNQGATKVAVVGDVLACLVDGLTWPYAAGAGGRGQPAARDCAADGCCQQVCVGPGLPAQLTIWYCIFAHCSQSSPLGPAYPLYVWLIQVMHVTCCHASSILPGSVHCDLCWLSCHQATTDQRVPPPLADKHTNPLLLLLLPLLLLLSQAGHRLRGALPAVWGACVQGVRRGWHRLCGHLRRARCVCLPASCACFGMLRNTEQVCLFWHAPQHRTGVLVGLFLNTDNVYAGCVLSTASERKWLAVTSSQLASRPKQAR